MRSAWYLSVLFLSACGSGATVAPVSTVIQESKAKDKIASAMSVVAATPEECAKGGSVIVTYLDENANLLFDDGDTKLSTNKICNGSNGQDGIGAGIIFEPASQGVCQAGGSVIGSFADKNNNGTRESDETFTASTTLCNGIAGTNGTGVHLSVTAAPVLMCPSGGAVYTSGNVGSSETETSVICNGDDGRDGDNAKFQLGSIGQQIPGREYSACHHDYLYFPSADPMGHGWLTIRHQKNGAADQGIGSTGFQVWNVDIVDFLLVSEVGGVNYCQMHWDAQTRKLSFSVIDPTDGLAGTTGEIELDRW